MFRVKEEKVEIAFLILTVIFFGLMFKYGWAWVGAYVFGSIFTLKSAYESLKEKKIEVDILMLMGAYGAAYLGKFHEGAFLLLLFNLGNTLEHIAINISKGSLKSLLSLKPEKARVIRDNEVKEIDVEDVKRGDVLVVKAGERVAVDGVVIEGKSSVDLSAITGEYIPEVRKEGDSIVSGALVIDGSLKILAKSTSKESTLEKIVKLVTEAQKYRSKTQTLAEWVGQKYTLGVIITLPVVFGVFYLIVGNFHDALYRTLVHLVVASPCAFVISTPVAIMSAIASSARKGILYKGGIVVEEIHKVKWVALDKTGTITSGKPKVKEISVLCDCHDKISILSIASSLEANVVHPIAEAIVKEGEKKNVERLPVNDVRYSIGYGVSGKINGNTWEVVSSKGRNDIKGMVLSVRKDGNEEAVIVLEDEIKEGANEAINTLKNMGYNVIMISGDRYENVKEIARRLSIEYFIAGATPEEKLKKIRELDENGGCCMVGDGINDGPALAAATFGVAMGTLASDVAFEVSDVNVLSDNLKLLPKVFEFSRKAHKVILQNVSISLGSVVVMIILNLLGLTDLMFGVIGHEGTTVLVAINGLRLLLTDNVTTL